MKETPSDAELVALARAGREEGYHEIVRRYQRPLYGLILRLVRDPGLAEDLAQEAFVKAFAALERYDPQRKLSSWLFKIAHNATLDHLRRRTPSEVPLEGGAGSGDGGDGGGGLVAVLAETGEPTPDRRAESSELGRQLEAALAELRPAYREVIVLRHVEGLAYTEIAEVTAQALGTVKTHLHRARKELAARLAERGYAAPDAETRGRTGS